MTTDLLRPIVIDDSSDLSYFLRLGVVVCMLQRVAIRRRDLQFVLSCGILGVRKADELPESKVGTYGVEPKVEDWERLIELAMKEVTDASSGNV